MTVSWWAQHILEGDGPDPQRVPTLPAQGARTPGAWELEVRTSWGSQQVLPKEGHRLTLPNVEMSAQVEGHPTGSEGDQHLQ